MNKQTPTNRDLSSFWMPFTPNRQFKEDPRLIASASGMYYTTDEGQKILDGFAGLWCCNAGHGNPEIADAVHRQLTELDYASSFNVGHPKAFEFASRLTELAPEGFDQVFFTNSGSESVDTALKIALAYQRARGQGGRTRLIGRERGYHGVGFGGISVGGMVNNRRQFGAMIAGVDHIRSTHAPDKNAFSRGQPNWGAHLADDLQRLVDLHGAETIAAVIIEPVAGATGVLPPPKGYLERLREICTANGILLIFDEVITAFGRLGTPFAAQYFGVAPDIITTAKGITNGVLPMGGVFVQSHVYDTMMSGPEEAVELFHGYTYSGHPVACAAGLAALDIYERKRLFENAAKLAPVFENALHSLKGAPNVVDIRNLGLMGGIELDPRPDARGARGYDVFRHCWENGAMVRPVGDVMALSPSLIAETHHLDTLVEKIGEALEAVD